MFDSVAEAGSKQLHTSAGEAPCLGTRFLPSLKDCLLKNQKQIKKFYKFAIEQADEKIRSPPEEVRRRGGKPYDWLGSFGAHKSAKRCSFRERIQNCLKIVWKN